ncbi:Gfo/Idh/MocA family protein [Prochlorococcus marinus]|nr:Gfo/Idh/MocA family oxidoreductase [Prochlorococcus marinus]
MADNKINIALVGCGRISKNHIKAIYNHSSKATLIAICDPEEGRIQTVIQSIKKDFAGIGESPISFTSYKHMLESHERHELKIDLVVIATPSGMHSSQVIMAAKKGIHCCSEKPMATNWTDAKEMVKACEDNDVKLFIMKQNRLNKTLKLLKEQIEKKRFGKIYLVNANVFWQRPQSYYDQDKWRGTKNLDGGALMNQGIHYVDLIQWLIGPIIKINAFTATLGREIECEDTATLQFSWESGTLGTMAITMLTFPHNIEGSITVLGEKGSVKIGGVALNEIKYWNFKDINSDDKEKVEFNNYKIDNVYGFGHEKYYLNMINVLNGKEDPICSGKSGLNSLELVVAAYKSANTNQIVEIPLDLE